MAVASPSQLLAIYLERCENMKTKAERLKERAELQKQNIGFDDDGFYEHFSKLMDTYTPNELLAELVQCGLELSKEEKAKWIDPIYIDTEEEVDRLVAALEKASDDAPKDIKVDYKEVTDPKEIKEMFGNGEE